MAVALSIRQPWVELILRGVKTIEVRTWATKHRGELWLHAGLKPDGHALQRFDVDHGLTFGAILGKCQLLDCIEFTVQTWDAWREQHLNEGPLTRKTYAWMLGAPERTAATAYKGRLGLMELEGGLP